MRRFYVIGLWAVLGCLFGWNGVPGARAQSVVSPSAFSSESIQQHREAVEADANLAEDLKSSTLDFYDRALRALEAADAVAADLAGLEAEIATANEQIAALRERLGTPADPVAELDVSPEATLEELQTLANEGRADLRIAREHLKEREALLSELTVAGAAYSEQLAERERQLRRTVADLRAAAPANESAALLEARQMFLRANQRLQENQIAFIRRGLGSYDTLVQLYTLKRDAAAADLGMLEPQMAALEALLQERREDRARAAREKAEVLQTAAAMLPEAVAVLAKENTNLRTELEELTRAASEVAESLRTAERRAASLESDLGATRERVEAVGASEAIGRLLRRRLARLPSSDDYRRQTRKHQSEISRATDRRIDVEEAQRALADPNQQAESILASVGPELERFDADWLRTQTHQLLTARLATLAELHQEYGRYLTQLAALDVAGQRLVGSVNETVEFINEQLFWIRSLPPFSFKDLLGLPQALGRLVSPKDWTRALKDCATEFFDHPVTSVAAILAVFGIFFWRTQTSRRLRELAEQTRRIRTDSFTHTAKAVLYTLIAASAWPFVLAIAGWHVRADPIGAPYSIAMGEGLLTAAMVLFIFSIYRWVAHPEGLGNRHFRWPSAVTAEFAKQLHWLSWIVVLAVYLVATTRASGEIAIHHRLRPTCPRGRHALYRRLCVALFQRSEPLHEAPSGRAP